jgi:hypothetical protein
MGIYPVVIDGHAVSFVRDSTSLQDLHCNICDATTPGFYSLVLHLTKEHGKHINWFEKDILAAQANTARKQKRPMEQSEHAPKRARLAYGILFCFALWV